ncbi:hypothetical protein BG015_011870 [Linnemannia schmuckeri]|uniref:Uncharacterized protein n=1 Tax=Linnemannia schmuckeri TaxID=64567 RepID=A0A9P5RRZ6_9FUNG|nr:hypothetical protein BG015_011870 [Linnemannia schmuckeri]
MGLLNLTCLTSDSNKTSFYGVAFARDYSSNNDKPEYAIVVRSNTNPTSPTNITWTTISMFDSSKLAGYPDAAKGVDYSCAYNEQGIFTLFGRTTGGSSKVPIMVPFGIRYDPTGSMDPRFDFQGTGAWMNISVDTGHTWSGGFTRYSLGYINNGSTKALVHASISETNNTVSLATVDDSTRTLAATTIWTNATVHGRSLHAIVIDNDHLYAYGEGFSENYRTYLTGFPLNTTTISPTTPVSRRYNTTQIDECYGSPKPFMYFVDNSLRLLCPMKKSNQSYTGDITIMFEARDPNVIMGPKDDMFQSLTSMIAAIIIDMDFFVPVGDWMNLPPSAFALLKSEGTIYAFGSGDMEGTRYNRTASQVIVAEPYGINPNPPPPPAAPESSILSTGGIVGIVIGTFVLTVCTFLLGRMTSGWRISGWSRKKKDGDSTVKTNADKSQLKQTSDISKDDHRAQGPKNGRNCFDLEGKYLDSIYPESQTNTMDTPPLVPAPPMPLYFQEQSKALQDQMRILQELILAKQLSSHPQPKSVTTAIPNGIPTTPAASEQLSEATAAPIPTTPTVSAACVSTSPFAPPAGRAAENESVLTSSVLAHTNDSVEQSSSQDSQATVEPSERIVSASVPSSTVNSP